MRGFIRLLNYTGKMYINKYYDVFRFHSIQWFFFTFKTNVKHIYEYPDTMEIYRFRCTVGNFVKTRWM